MYGYRARAVGSASARVFLSIFACTGIVQAATDNALVNPDVEYIRMNGYRARLSEA